MSNLIASHFDAAGRMSFGAGEVLRVAFIMKDKLGYPVSFAGRQIILRFVKANAVVANGEIAGQMANQGEQVIFAVPGAFTESLRNQAGVLYEIAEVVQGGRTPLLFNTVTVSNDAPYVGGDVSAPYSDVVTSTMGGATVIATAMGSPGLSPADLAGMTPKEYQAYNRQPAVDAASLAALEVEKSVAQRAAIQGDLDSKLSAGPVLLTGTRFPIPLEFELTARTHVLRFRAANAAARISGTTDDTDAFLAAIASGRPIMVPAKDGPYRVNGAMIDPGGVDMLGIGKPRVICTKSTAYLTFTGERSKWSGFQFEPVQASTQFQIIMTTTAQYNELDDIEIVLGNSGIRIEGQYNRLNNIRMREMRGTCMRLQGPQAYRNILRNIDMRNGALAGILADDGAAYNTIDGAYKYVLPQYFNAFLLAQREAVNGKLGGDVFASTIECHHNTIRNVRCDNARDGCFTFSGDDNVLDGALFNDGFASGLNVSGSRNKISNVQSIRCKTGFWIFPQAGGLGKDNTYVNCFAQDCTQYGFRHENRPYRVWSANLSQVPATHFCCFGSNVYQCSPAAADFGDQPPVHTSGTVSDGLVDWKWVAGTLDNLDADRTTAVACTSRGSAIADWYAEGTGKLTRIGCPGFAAISVVPTYTYDSIEPTQVVDAPILINGEFHYWPNGPTVAIGSAAVFGPGGWKGARGAGTGSLQQIAGEQSPYAIRMQRTPGDTSATSLYLYQVITGDAARKLRGQKLSATLRARAGATFSPSSAYLNYGIYASTSTAAPPNSGVPSGSTTLISGAFALRPGFNERGIPASDVVVPADAEMIILRFNFTAAGTAGDSDYVDVELPAMSAGKASAVFTPQAINVTKLRLNLYYIGTPPAPVIGRTGNWMYPLTMKSGAAGTVATSAGTRYFYPVQAPNLSLTSLGIELLTAGAAGSKARLALYTHDDVTGGPGVLLADGGEADCSTAGVKSLAIGPVAASGSWVWLMVQTNVAVTFRTSDTGLAVIGGNTFAAFIKGLSEASGTYAAPPASAPATLVNSGVGPICGVMGTRT
ncbi:hypothetical protein [Sphingomonas faeni]|uniref:hypothetical protein n=1 Tax=Sphingomonas faeni TaxID=185950 RepID=UPI00335911A2